MCQIHPPRDDRRASRSPQRGNCNDGDCTLSPSPRIIPSYTGLGNSGAVVSRVTSERTSLRVFSARSFCLPFAPRGAFTALLYERIEEETPRAPYVRSRELAGDVRARSPRFNSGAHTRERSKRGVGREEPTPRELVQNARTRSHKKNTRRVKINLTSVARPSGFLP